MSLTSKMRERQSPFGYEDDKLWLLTQDELQAAARLGVPVETIMGKHTLYLGDASKEDTRTIKFYNDGEEIEITAYGVRESVISDLERKERFNENIGMMLRVAFEFASEMQELRKSERNWDLLVGSEGASIIDLEQSRTVGLCKRTETARSIITANAVLPFVVETLRRALIDHYEHGVPVPDNVRDLALSIVQVKSDTKESAR